MTTIKGDVISAVDLGQVIMLNTYSVNDKVGYLQSKLSGKRSVVSVKYAS